MDRDLIASLSYEIPSIWVCVRDQQRIFDDPERSTWKAFNRVREALYMFVEPWRY